LRAKEGGCYHQYTEHDITIGIVH